MKKLATFTDINKAQALASILRANGVECDIRNEHTATINWLYTNAIGGLQVVVGPDQIAEGEDLLELFHTNASYQKCPDCSSHEVRYVKFGIFNAISIYLGFCLPSKNYKMKCDECGAVFGRCQLVEEDSENLKELENLAVESKNLDAEPQELPIYFSLLKGYIVTFVLMFITSPLGYLFFQNYKVDMEFLLFGPLLGGGIGMLLKYADEQRNKCL